MKKEKKSDSITQQSGAVCTSALSFLGQTGLKSQLWHFLSLWILNCNSLGPFQLIACQHVECQLSVAAWKLFGLSFTCSETIASAHRPLASVSVTVCVTAGDFKSRMCEIYWCPVVSAHSPVTVLFPATNVQFRRESRFPKDYIMSLQNLSKIQNRQISCWHPYLKTNLVRFVHPGLLGFLLPLGSSLDHPHQLETLLLFSF